MPVFPAETVFPSKALFPSVAVAAAPTPPRRVFKGVPKLQVPLRFQGGGLALVEQDSFENVAASVYAILSYELGQRIEDPDFGVEDPTFEETPLDTSEWVDAVNRYEPRAEVGTSQEVEEFLDAVLVEVGER